MIDKIVNLIKTKTDNQPNSVLYTQWNASKDYVIQNLSTISHMFPHYSLHDISHSESILINIERIVGKKTFEEKFSAEDLWLLLCGACYHDLGMFVSGQEKNDLMVDTKFIEYVKKIQHNKKAYLHQYAIFFETEGEKLAQKETLVENETINALNFLIADYIRKQHGERSAKKIMEDKNLALDFVPERMKRILSIICKCHTSSFEDIVYIQHTEKGIGLDDCHPKYIACLLRLGDLLDMDNNRFSNVILSTLPSIPIDALHHKAKHVSVEHLEISTSRISATAICEDVDVADLTQQWFAMLNTEVTNQMKKWSDIVPDASYGFLPTLGDLHVTLKGYDTINGKIKNSFQIDTSKAIELIQGSGLYDSPIQSIRELLQNSVDATLLRIFVENNEIWDNDDNRVFFAKECIKYPIKVYISHGNYQTQSNKLTWEINIVDQGYGMGLEDIKILTQIATDKTDTRKRQIIQSMPEWMKPSGTFGIGFQSIYLLADIVHIKTHQHNSEYTYDLTLYNPIKEKEGLVLLKTDSKSPQQQGTQITFTLTVEKIPSTWSVSFGSNSAWDVLKTYDFVADESLDIEIAKIIDYIILFATESDIPIMIYNKHTKIFDSTSCIHNSLKENSNAYFSNQLNVEVLPSFMHDNKPYMNKIYYRGQSVQYSSELRFANFTINLLEGNAKDILTLNRNEIKNSYTDLLDEKIILAIIEYILCKYDRLQPEEKIWASMFINFYTIGARKSTENYLLKYNAWENHVIKSIDDLSTKTLKEICTFEKIIFREIVDTSPMFTDDMQKMPLPSFIVDQNNAIIICYKYHCDDILFLHKIIRDQYIHTCINFYENSWKKHEIFFSKVKIDNVISDMELWLEMYMHTTHYHRGVMPCSTKYEKLAIKPNNMLRVYCGIFAYQGPLMVCPYTKIYKKFYCVGLKYDTLSDSLFSYVYENRLNVDVTLDEIKDMYYQFKEETKDIINKINKKEKSF